MIQLFRLLLVLPMALIISGAEVRAIKLAEFKGTNAGFTRLPASATGISFVNEVADIRAITNRNLLSGSGVAAADADGDGLCDLYFCALDRDNVFYRNLGNFKFEDVTARTPLALPGLDCTGAVFADVDGDGDSDLLVTGLGSGARLFRNDGNFKFVEVTKTAGLESATGAMSMALADIDGDGDLDLYVANYRPTSLKDIPEAKFRVDYVNGRPVISQFNGRPTTSPELTNRFVLAPSGEVLELGEADQLYLNDGKGLFTPVSFTGGAFLDEEGKPLREPPYDWGLAAMFYDFSGDGFPDLYVCNDLFSPDRIWINDGAGKFKAASSCAIRSTSTFSMGIDFADVNRDGFADFFVTDMLSASHSMRQTQVGEFSPHRQLPGMVAYRQQKSQNTLQANRRNAEFAEIGQYAGVEASEWSWGPIFLDVDLDGYEDLLISNGNQYDVQNADVASQIEKLKAEKKLTHQEILRLLKLFPNLESRKLIFRNRGDFTFSEVGRDWGFADTGISQGMALADLDNDGDLDVVINNLGKPAGVYRNDSDAPRVAVKLKGDRGNTHGVGAKIRFLGGPVEQSQEMIAGGRYLSSDEPMRVFATGRGFQRGTIEVTWRDGKRSVVEEARANHLYEISEAGAAPRVEKGESNSSPWFEDVSNLLNHSHVEEPFDDFARQPLLPYKLSQMGPGVSWHDFDRDGWDDLVIPSGRGGRLAVYRNDQKGGFEPVAAPFLQRPISRDQTTALGIGPVLFIGSSNYEDGMTNGGLTRVYDLQRKVAGENLLGSEFSVGPMAMADVDGNGHPDLFIGGRSIAGEYAEPAPSVLYLNEGSRFVPAQRFEKLGLVSGAVFSDIDQDGDQDIILACHWGPLKVLRNDKGKFSDVTEALGLDSWTGLWNGVATGDFNNDGLPDIVASNWGLNTRWRASKENPLKLYHGDLDGNGIVDLVETTFDAELKKEVPIRNLKSVGPALPYVMERMRSFQQYGSSSIAEIFGENIGKASVARVNTLTSMVFINRGGKFEAKPLPVEIQFAPAFGISVGDVDADGNQDLFISQNFFATNPEMPRSDAGIGQLLRGDGAGNFKSIPGHVNGIKVYGEQRGCAFSDFDHDGRLDLVVTQNAAATKLFHNRQLARGVRVVFGPNAPNGGIGSSFRVIKDDKKGPLIEVQSGSGYWSLESATKIIPSNGGMKLEYKLAGGATGSKEIPEGAKEIVIP